MRKLQFQSVKRCVVPVLHYVTETNEDGIQQLNPSVDPIEYPSLDQFPKLSDVLRSGVTLKFIDPRIQSMDAEQLDSFKAQMSEDYQEKITNFENSLENAN